MKKRIFVFLALIFAVVRVFLFSPLPAQAAERLRVVLDRVYPPFTYFDENGEFKGISVEFWELWEKKTGIPVELVPVEFQKALGMIRNHEADVIDIIFFTPERAEYLDYVQPLFPITSSVYYRRVYQDIRSFSNLTPFIVGAKEKDTLIGIALQENPKLQFKLYADYAEIVRAAKEGEVDVFLMDDPPASITLYALAYSTGLIVCLFR
ncbi:MAG: transporter substrate-binding domain-containing protein [Candidatus Caldatribacteriaceae bacterium]